MLPEGLGKAVESRLAPELGAKAAVVGYVVPVRASRSGFEEGRDVAIADPERREIRRQAGRDVERQIRTELEPIGGSGYAQKRSRVGQTDHRRIQPYSVVGPATPVSRWHRRVRAAST